MNLSFQALLTIPHAPATAGTTLPYWNPRHVPTGSATSVEDRYWNYLWAHLLQSGPGQQTAIHWAGLVIVFIWVVVLSILSYLLVTQAYYNQNKRGAATDPTGPEVQDLYPVESYNGVISERNGGVDAFNLVLYAMLLAYGLGIVFYQILNGQVY